MQRRWAAIVHTSQHNSCPGKPHAIHTSMLRSSSSDPAPDGAEGEWELRLRLCLLDRCLCFCCCFCCRGATGAATVVEAGVPSGCEPVAMAPDDAAPDSGALDIDHNLMTRETRFNICDKYT
jgi:hypothetical protein